MGTIPRFEQTCRPLQVQQVIHILTVIRVRVRLRALVRQDRHQALIRALALLPDHTRVVLAAVHPKLDLDRRRTLVRAAEQEQELELVRIRIIRRLVQALALDHLRPILILTRTLIVLQERKEKHRNRKVRMVHILILIYIPMKIRVKKMVMQLDRIIRPTMMLIIVMNIIRIILDIMMITILDRTTSMTPTRNTCRNSRASASTTCR